MAETVADRNETEPTQGLLANDLLVKRIGEAIAVGFLLLITALLVYILGTEINTDLLVTIFPRFVEAFLLVLQIVVISSILSVSLGVLVGLARISSSRLTSGIATGYVEFFRGTPLLFQLFVIFIGVPSLWGTGSFPIENWNIPAAIIGLTLNHGAYAGEAIRGGISSVSDGQLEAARSVGMSRVQAMREVVLPQAWRNALPALGNDQIILVKDTSLLTVLAVSEIISVFRNVNNTTFDSWTPLLWVCLFYLVITMSLSALVAYLEARADWSDESDSRIGDALGVLNDEMGVRR